MVDSSKAKAHVFSRDLRSLLVRWTKLNEGERLDALKEFSKQPAPRAAARLQDIVTHLVNDEKEQNSGDPSDGSAAA